MDDFEFFDTLFDMWKATTGAEDTYWDYEGTGENGFDLHSCNKDGDRVFVGYFESDADADFVTALHGCLPDLLRVLHLASSEAERMAIQLDETVRKLAEAELRVDELRQQVKDYEGDLEGFINA